MNHTEPISNDLPAGFTLGMACMDLLPVIFFSIGAIILGCRLNSGIFWIGTVCCIAAGLGKVGWKLCIAVAKKNIPLLNRQLRVLMPIGFAGLLIGWFTSQQKPTLAHLTAGIRQMPTVLFFGLGIAGIVVMLVMARTKSGLDAKANWQEQLINALTQLSLLIGLLLWH